jgi:2-keto-4-pentenoate hydratase/2-oxohepta-3-ene-1,7-dioic acid hydratase in catechol pathway
MRLGRIASPDGVAFVSIEGPPDDPTEAVAKEIAEHPFGTPTFTGRQWQLADVRMLAPILASKVVCIGKNYAAHVQEMGGGSFPDPVIFMKPNTAIIGPNIPIQHRTRSAEEGRPVDQGQGPRHVLSDRTLDRHRRRSIRSRHPHRSQR